MSKNSDNFCIRCGKQRVMVSTAKEQVNGSMVKVTRYTCPDLVCQEKVNQKLQQERQKVEEHIKRIEASMKKRFGKK